MKLPPLKLPCEVPTPAPSYDTDLGFPIRVIEGSVWRCDVRQPQKIAHHEEAVEWIREHVVDKLRANWLCVEVSGGKSRAIYDTNESAQRKRYETKGSRRKAK